MFKVLFAPFDRIHFERFGSQPKDETPAVMVYVSPKGARVLIGVEKGKEETEIPMVEAAAQWLNCSPSLEFTRLMLRSIKETWQGEIEPKESNLMRRLRFESIFRTNERQPPFAPNNGSRVDGYW